MRSVLVATLVIVITSFACGGDRASNSAPMNPRPVVVMKTSLGTMEITLDAEKAPVTVKNFLAYVEDGFYDNTVFHRIEPGILIQGGGFTVGMEEKKTRRPIKNEAANGLKNRRGTIVMARLDTVKSAKSQFFINLKDNPDFDHKDNSKEGFGYAVFGEVTSGMDVADTIAGTAGQMQVVIYSVRMRP